MIGSFEFGKGSYRAGLGNFNIQNQSITANNSIYEKQSQGSYPGSSVVGTGFGHYPKVSRIQEMYGSVISNAVKANQKQKKDGLVYGSARIPTSYTSTNLRNSEG